ncbi:MAG: hypothetical protein AAFZ91_15490 [Pseudomonadota bacterium]
MIRSSLLLISGCLCLTPAALAQYNYGQDNYRGYATSNQASNCERIQDDKRLIGGLIGAVAGGALGVAIADDGDDHYYHRRKRYHGHRGYGYRGYRGHHSYGYHDDGDEVAGALIGGVLGAVVGSQLAASGTDCSPKWSYSDVPPPTRQAYGQGWQPVPAPGSPSVSPPRSPGVVYQNDPNPVLYGGPTAATLPAPQPELRVERAATYEPAPATVLNCRQIQRQTQLPDGNTVLEPVEVCQNSSGQWEIQVVDELY